MSNLTEYFSKTTYKSTYNIGDRVTGRWNQIPFTGTVGNDRLVSEISGPEITVHLDLPIKYQEKILQFIVAKHSDVRLLK